jgi:hypothetical protein
MTRNKITPTAQTTTRITRMNHPRPFFLGAEPGDDEGGETFSALAGLGASSDIIEAV